MKIDEAAFLRLVRGESRGFLPGAARLGLGGISGLYRLGVGARNLAFDRGWKAGHRAEVPVISVGNLTLGGTGKTPMVEWVSRWFRSRGVRVAILSRGYGDSSGMNDEGRVLEENLPDVPHLQAPDRVDLAHRAVEELESQILVLDDGFQHRRLARDLDLVLLDALDPFGLGRVFPRGLLREPVGSLKRAGVVVLSRADLVDEPTRASIRERAERQAGPLRWATARHAPRDLLDDKGESYPLSDLSGRKVGAFCGIGNPEGFRRTLEGLGLELVGFRTFPDHHPYGAPDMADLSSWARSIGAEVALTTQKDSVKLRAPGLGPAPLRALRIGLEVMDGSETLDRALSDLMPPGEDAP
ncbi:tetraacyldisaccharide 4'-kinase [Tundrisphaera lichenicola]|uniref:tetraacyldisaccharide 4'-kinase n=1 Tax=Tundrisphaera lichenicola TaxID=2029860 RepID=UPI003EBB74DD